MRAGPSSPRDLLAVRPDHRGRGLRDAGRGPGRWTADRLQDPVAPARAIRHLPGVPGSQQPAWLSGSSRRIIPAQTPPPEPSSRRRRRQQQRAQATGRPTVRRPRSLPTSRPLWRNPTAITTMLAVIATVVLVIVLNSHAAAPTNPSALNPPANPDEIRLAIEISSRCSVSEQS